MQFRSAFQINIGLGAGNIGDDLISQALWTQIPSDFQFHVGHFPHERSPREPYPGRFSFHPLEPSGSIENAHVRDIPGLLAGTGCIFDRPGQGWPLQFLAPRLQHFHDHGLPVDAAGVSVEPLQTSEGRRLFDAHLRPIRSWSVTDAPSADVLTELGIDPVRIAVGADWAWLYNTSALPLDWAAATWNSLGIDLARPLLVVGVYWPVGVDSAALSTALAAALDSLHRTDDMQIAFVATDCRHPGFHRTAADAVQSRMTATSVQVPNEFYGPGELIALLSHATAVIARPYTLGVAAVLADTPPVFLAYRQNGVELAASLGFTPCGTYGAIDSVALIEAVRQSIAQRDNLPQIRSGQAARARRNFDFFRLFNGLSREPLEENGHP